MNRTKSRLLISFQNLDFLTAARAKFAVFLGTRSDRPVATLGVFLPPARRDDQGFGIPRGGKQPTFGPDALHVMPPSLPRNADQNTEASPYFRSGEYAFKKAQTRYFGFDGQLSSKLLTGRPDQLNPGDYEIAETVSGSTPHAR